MEMIEAAIKNYYGERCPDYDANCVVCQVWREFDTLEAGYRRTTAHAKKCTAEQLYHMFVNDGHTDVSVVETDPTDVIMEAAGFAGNELFQTHEVVALMQKAFDKGWDQTGAAATSLHKDFPYMHNHNRDEHVVRFLKEAMLKHTGEEL
jgi:hypothetical protein